MSAALPEYALLDFLTYYFGKLKYEPTFCAARVRDLFGRDLERAEQVREWLAEVTVTVQLGYPRKVPQGPLVTLVLGSEAEDPQASLLGDGEEELVALDQAGAFVSYTQRHRQFRQGTYTCFLLAPNADEVLYLARLVQQAFLDDRTYQGVPDSPLPTLADQGVWVRAIRMSDLLPDERAFPDLELMRQVQVTCTYAHEWTVTPNVPAIDQVVVSQATVDGLAGAPGLVTESIGPYPLPAV